MENYRYTARELAALAVHQKDVFIYCKSSRNSNVEASSLYNLTLAFELSLKAYLIYLNNSYSSEKKLRALGHKIRNIYKRIMEEDKNILKGEIESILNKDNYLEYVPNKIRYPKIGTQLRNAPFNDVINFINKIRILCP